MSKPVKTKKETLKDEARKRVRSMDRFDGANYIDPGRPLGPDMLGVIMAALDAGLNDTSDGSAYEAFVMLEALVEHVSKRSGYPIGENEKGLAKETGKSVYIKHDGKLYVNRGSFHTMDGRDIFHYSLVREAEGFEKQRYCKYCHESIKPILSGFWQITCSKCGYGLSPDFFTEEELKYWLENGIELNIEKDGNDELKKKHEESMKSFKERPKKEKRIIGKDGIVIILSG